VAVWLTVLMRRRAACSRDKSEDIMQGASALSPTARGAMAISPRTKIAMGTGMWVTGARLRAIDVTFAFLNRRATRSGSMER